MDAGINCSTVSFVHSFPGSKRWWEWWAPNKEELQERSEFTPNIEVTNAKVHSFCANALLMCNILNQCWCFPSSFISACCDFSASCREMTLVKRSCGFRNVFCCCFVCFCFSMHFHLLKLFCKTSCEDGEICTAAVLLPGYVFIGLPVISIH